MNADELSAILSELGLSQARFARCAGLTRNSVNRQVKAEHKISEPVAQIARLIRDYPDMVEVLENYDG